MLWDVAVLSAAACRVGGPLGTHRRDTSDRLNGADEDRCGASLGFRHHVQAVMDSVDKVHVGVARRPEHDPVPGGFAEAGMRGAIVLPDVGLDLDDSADPAAALVVADQPCAEQGPPGLQGRPGQGRPIDEPQPARG